MYDYGLSTLEQYDLTIKNTSRTRGAILCRAEEGLMILREFHGTEKKLNKQQELLLTLEEKGHLVDSFVPNKEGNLISCDRDQIPFTLQHWHEGRECDTRSGEDIQKSVRTLAKIHNDMAMPAMEDYMESSLEEEYLRHNQQLRKIRKFIRKKGPTNLFEKKYLASVEWFLQKGEDAAAMLADSGYDKLREESMEQGRVCHGEYNQHNVLMTAEGTAVVNFGHWGFDIQMADLYRFMRKILEKYNWDIYLAKELLRAYHNERPLSREEWQNLKIRFTYPEKYWKIANYYYSHNKAWISEKNVEKLNALIQNAQIWEHFTQECFSHYPF